MIRRFFCVIILLLLTTCDDGDIITISLDFEGDLEYCDNNTSSFLIYDTKTDPSESLSLIIPRATNQELPFTNPTVIGEPEQFEINASTIRFIYRTYNRALSAGELCETVAPADLIITEDYEANQGTVSVNVTIEDDDGDGIPSDLEGRGEPDESGNYPNAQDSDGDGIPDYQDQDDDNDNVLTTNEIDEENLDGDDDPTTNFLDTDSDGNPDYLDTDDDGDGVPTRQEDQSGDQNPRSSQNLNDDPDGNQTFHYLNILEVTDYGDSGAADGNTYTRTITASFIITNYNLEILSSTELDFGTLSYPITISQ